MKSPAVVIPYRNEFTVLVARNAISRCIDRKCHEQPEITFKLNVNMNVNFKWKFKLWVKFVPAVKLISIALAICAAQVVSIDPAAANGTQSTVTQIHNQQYHN